MHVEEFTKKDSADISELLKEVWDKAVEYPEGWRKKRAMSKEAAERDMDEGYRYFGVRLNGELVGMYKLSVTGRGCFGENQAILPEYWNTGVASAMYHQFFKFAKGHGCPVNYVNILVGQKSGEKLMEKFGFYKVGEPYEQHENMPVQMYERKVEKD